MFQTRLESNLGAIERIEFWRRVVHTRFASMREITSSGLDCEDWDWDLDWGLGWGGGSGGEWRGRGWSGSERGSAMEVEVEKREEREVEGKTGWRDGRHRRSLELLEMNAMVGEE